MFASLCRYNMLMLLYGNHYSYIVLVGSRSRYVAELLIDPTLPAVTSRNSDILLKALLLQMASMTQSK